MIVSSAPTMRLLTCWKTYFPKTRLHILPATTRHLSAISPVHTTPPPLFLNAAVARSTPKSSFLLPLKYYPFSAFLSSPQPHPPPPSAHLPTASLTHIKTFPPPRSVRRAFPNALAEAQNAHISVLDPSGNRTRLFARSNPDAPQPGDILLAIFKSGEPFAGVCLSIRRRGTDTAVLLRNTLMMTGVELWVKIYSPNVRGIEVVQRALKRARRARLFYMRFVVSFFSHLFFQPFSNLSTTNPYWSSLLFVFPYERQRRMLTFLGGKLGNQNMIAAVWKRLLKST